MPHRGKWIPSVRQCIYSRQACGIKTLKLASSSVKRKIVGIINVASAQLIIRQELIDRFIADFLASQDVEWLGFRKPSLEAVQFFSGRAAEMYVLHAMLNSPAAPFVQHQAIARDMEKTGSFAVRW